MILACATVAAHVTLGTLADLVSIAAASVSTLAVTLRVWACEGEEDVPTFIKQFFSIKTIYCSSDTLDVVLGFPINHCCIRDSAIWFLL